MFSRRSFLKLSAAAAVSLTAGYSAGNLFRTQNEYSAVLGFLPAEKYLLNEFIALFNRQTGSSLDVSEISINNSPVYLEKGTAKLKIFKLPVPGKGDILISDNLNTVYDPERDFSYMYSSLRNKIRNREAAYFVSAEYRPRSLGSLFNGSGTIAVIENESGVFDKVKLSASPKEIYVPGPLGNTGIKISSGTIHVSKPVCRHKLCARSFGNSVIACAPNKILVTIV